METFKEFKKMNEKRILNPHSDIQKMIQTVFPAEQVDRKMVEELETVIKKAIEPVIKKYGYDFKK